MDDKVCFANFNSGSYDVKSSRTYWNIMEIVQKVYTV